MDKHISKRLFAGILALSAGFVLASCDPITATPKSYNDAIILNKADDSKVDFEDNLMGKIYEAIATDRNTKIVSDILEEVATNKFGTYYEIVKASESNEAKVAFADAHADVFVREDDSTLTGKTANEIKIHRFDKFLEDVKERISEVFYNEIVSGSYNDDEGKFIEKKLWMAHYYEFYDLGDIASAPENEFFVTNKITKENALDQLDGTYDVYEQRVAWEAQTEEYKKEHPFTARGYIEEKILPQILKDKLVEEYVYNNNFSSLGRTYARKVNYIKVSYEDYAIPWSLLKSFSDEYVVSNKELDFEVVTQAIKGFKDIGDNLDAQVIIKFETTDPSYTLLQTTLGVEDTSSTGNAVVVDADYKLGSTVLIPAGTYYKNTKLGELIVSYQKAIKAEESGRFPLAEEKAELDKFTSSGKSKEYGLREKLISLIKEDYTTDGWYVKNGGLTELPSDLRDRLFNINVANHLNDGEYVHEHKLEGEYTEDTMGKYQEYQNGKRLPYMRNIYGKMMLIPSKSQSYEDNHYNYIFQDVDGKAFYMVQVLEAPSTPKLNKEQASSYAKNDPDVFKTEDIAKEVAKILGTKDSYIKDAYTEILENYTFAFYETSLYEHFKAEYPELFEEEE